MDKGPGASAYKADFIGRIRAARDSRFAAQEDLCEVLDIKQSLYGKYETRSLMPHNLIPRFCKACGVTTEWLFTGKSAGPAWMPFHPAPAKRRPAAKPRRVA